MLAKFRLSIWLRASCSPAASKIAAISLLSSALPVPARFANTQADPSPRERPVERGDGWINQFGPDRLQRLKCPALVRADQS
jgi:hypothetical protein